MTFLDRKSNAWIAGRTSYSTQGTKLFYEKNFANEPKRCKPCKKET